MRRAIVCVAVLSVLSGIAGDVAMAESNTDRQLGREREMLRRLQDLTRQSAQEKAALSAEIEDLKKKLKAAEQGATRTAQKGRDTEKALAVEAAEKARLITQKSGLEAQLEEAQLALQDTRRSLAAAEDALRANRDALESAARVQQEQGAEIERGKALIVQREREIGVCESKNMKLYGYNVELLDRYQNKGVWDAIRKKEPFTGLKGVELENLIEEYRDKVDEQQIISGRSRPGQQ